MRRSAILNSSLTAQNRLPTAANDRLPNQAQQDEDRKRKMEMVFGDDVDQTGAPTPKVRVVRDQTAGKLILKPDTFGSESSLYDEDGFLKV